MRLPERGRWPLRQRLVWLMLAVVTAVLALTMWGLSAIFPSLLYSDVDARLSDAQTTTLVRYPFPDAAPARGASDLTIQVVDGGGSVVRVLQTQTRGGAEAPTAADARAAIRAGRPVSTGTRDGWRLLARRLPDGTWLVAAQPLRHIQGLHEHLLVGGSAVALGALLATGLVTMRLVRYGLRPLAEIAYTAGRIEAGDLSRRAPVTSRDEVGQLAAALNGMLDRIEASFAERRAAEERLRRFVDDAGHELRTPVTAIRGWADLYRKGGVNDDELPTAMRRIEEEAGRIGALVDDLLLLASLDMPAEAPHQRVDLAEVVRDALLDARAVEPARPLTSEVPPEGVAVVDGDPMALHQVVANLLANVRAHTPAGTPAHVTVERAGDRVVLRVTDSGPGVPAELRGRIFDRFVRADPGRTHRGPGGAGLGLSIVASIVARHGGDVRAEPGGAGFTVCLSFPASDSAPSRP